NTRMILDKARERTRSPWVRARFVLALLAMALGVVTGYAVAGEPPQPLMQFAAQADVGLSNTVAARVEPETQMRRADLYDTDDQFNQWGGAACSAAVLSEVLTAYGVRGATIGHMIDELGSYISSNAGLLNYDGFAKVAGLHGYRADIYLDDKPLTY